MYQGRTQDFKLGGLELSEFLFFQIRIHALLKKLSTKINTQKSLFLNILDTINYQQKQKTRNTIAS